MQQPLPLTPPYAPCLGLADLVGSVRPETAVGGWEMVATGVNVTNTARGSNAVRTATACKTQWDTIKKFVEPSGGFPESPWGDAQRKLLEKVDDAMRLAFADENQNEGQGMESESEGEGYEELLQSSEEEEVIEDFRAPAAAAAAAAAPAAAAAAAPAAAAASGRGKNNSIKAGLVKALDRRSLTSSGSARGGLRCASRHWHVRSLRVHPPHPPTPPPTPCPLIFLFLSPVAWPAPPRPPPMR